MCDIPIKDTLDRINIACCSVAEFNPRKASQGMLFGDFRQYLSKIQFFAEKLLIRWYNELIAALVTKSEAVFMRITIKDNERRNMKKIMFDSNAFSSMLNSNLDWTSFFAKYEDEFEFFVTAIQIEELTEIPDSKRALRIQHILCLCQMRAKIVPNILVLGYGRAGLSVLANKEDTTYENLLFENRSNVKDAIIGEAAKREGCILVTDDTKFIPKLRKVGIPTMTFDEFMKSVFV